MTAPARAVFMGGAVLFTLTSRVALADDAVTPESLIDQGVELRRTGHDDKAHGYFKRAYDMTHAPRPAAQLGLVELALGRNGPAQK